MGRFLQLNYYGRISLGIVAGLQLLSFIQTGLAYESYDNPFVPTYVIPLSYLMTALPLVSKGCIVAGFILLWMKKKIGWIIGIPGLLFNMFYYLYLGIASGNMSVNILILAFLLFGVVCIAILFSPSVRQQLEINLKSWVISACILVVFLLIHFYEFELAMFIDMHFY
ncbi:MAG: hypothetical protein K0S33_2874 [Bacteroidetes bacterium]|jgi:hypothetical protein|nr:hypothetical protein [Bacteroidota bacterium]